MVRAGWNLPNATVNLQYVGSDTVCVMKRFFLFPSCILVQKTKINVTCIVSKIDGFKISISSFLFRPLC